MSRVSALPTGAQIESEVWVSAPPVCVSDPVDWGVPVSGHHDRRTQNFSEHAAESVNKTSRVRSFGCVLQLGRYIKLDGGGRTGINHIAGRIYVTPAGRVLIHANDSSSITSILPDELVGVTVKSSHMLQLEWKPVQSPVILVENLMGLDVCCPAFVHLRSVLANRECMPNRLQSYFFSW